MAAHRMAVTATKEFPVAMAVVRRILKDLGEVLVVPLEHRRLSPFELQHFQEAFGQVDAVLLRPGFFCRELVESASRLKIIAVHGVGVDHVDVPAATARGILVTNTPGVNASTVAELTLGMILSLLRRIPEADARVRLQGQWGEARALGRELRGKVLGLIGIGAVGTQVAKLAQAFGASTMAYDPYADSQAIPSGVRLADFDALLSASDIISVHARLTSSTRGMLNADAFKKMKSGVYLINTARGRILDEMALLDALQSGHVAGAAIDVLTEEPPQSRPALFDHPNVIATPHMGSSTMECIEKVAEAAAQEIARCLRGEMVHHAVNPEAHLRRT